MDWESDYKWHAHQRWEKTIDRKVLRTARTAAHFRDVAARAVAIEARTNLLFSFEKMALRDAVKPPAGARSFVRGIHDFLHGPGSPEDRFNRCEIVANLPRRQTRVLTWPVVTVMGFIARPQAHVFLKPTVTRKAAQHYGFPFDLSVTTELGHLCEPARVRPDRAPGHG